MASTAPAPRRTSSAEDDNAPPRRTADGPDGLDQLLGEALGAKHARDLRLRIGLERDHARGEIAQAGEELRGGRRRHGRAGVAASGGASPAERGLRWARRSAQYASATRNASAPFAAGAVSREAPSPE